MKKLLSLLLFFACLSWGAQAQEAEVTHVWEFDAPVVNKKVQGWEAINYANPNTVDGILNLTAVTNMGYPDLEYKIPASVTLDPAVSKQIVIKLKNGTQSRRCRFYWVKNGVQYRHDFLVSVQDTEFHEYVIDLTKDTRWSGTLESIRFEIPMPVPSNSHNTIVSVDYIKILKAPAALEPMPAMVPAPFGVNLAGAGFAGDDYQYPHAEELDYFKSKGLNLMRVSFKWERLQPELQGAFDERNINDLRKIVWAARRRGMWVLLDLHNYGRRTVNGVNTVIGNPGLSIADLADVWVKLAEEFKDYGNIYAYGLMNEPYGMTKHTPWVNIAQGVIDAIRTVDTHTPIMVGGDSYSSTARWIAESDNLRGLVDPSDNLIFEGHVYFDNDASGSYAKNFDDEKATPTTGVNRLRPFVEWLKKYNLRGFIGEYGIPDNDVRWLEVLDNTLQYMKENHLNGTYWAAGSRWGDYKLSVHPYNDGSDRPQMPIIEKYLYADAPSPQPEITSPYAANFNVHSTVNYKVTATNNPTSFTVTGLPDGLSFNNSTNTITGTITEGTFVIQLSATNAEGTGSVREVELRGMNLNLPGVVEAEHYDNGGNNIGYLDKTVGNSGNATYRHEDVDLRSTDTPENFAVSNTTTDEWLKYTVNVQQEGSYRVKMRYSTPTTTASGAINLKIDGVALAGDVELSPSANKDSWKEVVFDVPVISQGIHVLELHVANEGFDFDKFEFTINVAPSAPTGLTAEAFGSDKVNLNWNAVNGASSYKVKRSLTEDGTFTTLVENLTATSYTDENLTAETTYYYVVVGTNIMGEGTSSAKVSATTASLGGPATVTGLTGVAGDGRVVLNWTAVPDVTQYIIKRSTVSGSGYAQIATSTTPTYKDETAENETTYYYIVVAENALGVGNNSAEFAATPRSGRYAYWNFDETSGTIATDSWNDMIATLGSGTSLVSAKVNNGVEFNGSAESFVTLPQGVVSSLNAITISAWINPSTYKAWVRVFDFGSNENNTTSYMYLTSRNGVDGRVRFAIRNGSALEQLITTQVTLQAGVWTHVAVTLAEGVGILYVNGVEVGRNDNITHTPADLGYTPQNWIGKSQFSSDPNFEGKIDEFKIFSNALNPSEIASLHTNSSGPLSVSPDTESGVDVIQTYPNPSQGTFKLQVNTAKNGKIKLLVYNAVGSIVYTMDDIKNGPYQKEVRLQKLKAGMYFIKVLVGDFSQAKSIIVE